MKNNIERCPDCLPGTGCQLKTEVLRIADLVPNRLSAKKVNNLILEFRKIAKKIGCLEGKGIYPYFPGAAEPPRRFIEETLVNY